MSRDANLYSPEINETETAMARAMGVVSALVGIQIQSVLDEIGLIQSGVPTKYFESLKQLGLSPADSSWIIKPRTLAHRKSKQERLTREETERWLRAVKIFALANEVFGHKDKAIQWLHKPRNRFGGHSAIDVMQNEPGAHLVEETLNQIDSGYFA